MYELWSVKDGVEQDLIHFAWSLKVVLKLIKDFNIKEYTIKVC